MVWVMSMMAMPRLRTRSMVSRPRRVCSTPRAAKGSSRMTSLPPQWTKRLSSIAWRWPPERCSTLVREARDAGAAGLERAAGLGLHLAVAEEGDAEDAAGELAAHEEVGDDVEVGAEREVLVDGLDAGGLGLALRGEAQLRAVEDEAARARALLAGDDLDQRGLAGAVVAEERHHLAGGDGEVTPRSASMAPKLLRMPVSSRSGKVTHGCKGLRAAWGGGSRAASDIAAARLPPGARLLAAVTIAHGGRQTEGAALVPAGASHYRPARCTEAGMDDERAYEEIGGAPGAPLLVICDHATNRVPASVAGGDLGLPAGGDGPAYRLRHRGARGDAGAGAAPARAGASHPLLAAGHRPEPRRGRPDAGDAALRRHDHPGQPPRRRPRRSSGGSTPGTGPTIGRSTRRSSG